MSNNHSLAYDSFWNKDNCTFWDEVPAFSIPQTCKHYWSRSHTARHGLDLLIDARVSLADFLILVLEDSNHEFASSWTAFYKEENSQKLNELLDVI